MSALLKLTQAAWLVSRATSAVAATLVIGYGIYRFTQDERERKRYRRLNARS